MRKPRLILADDHRLIRESLAKVLSDAHEIVATATNGEELLRLLETRAADCVILDLEMPGIHGMDLIRAVRRRRPEWKIVVLTMHVDRRLAAAALRWGADGYLPKDCGVEELHRAIAEVSAGRAYLSPHLSPARHRVGLEAQHPGLQRLTARQQEVLLLIGEGRSAANIARDLGVGESTVAFHKANIMRTLGFASGERLMRFAVLVGAAVQDAGGGG